MLISISIKLANNNLLSLSGRPAGDSNEKARLSNLSLNSTSSNSKAYISARSLAERTALARVSELSSSLNLREDSTLGQLQTLNSLIDLADKISTENISSRVSSLQSEAAQLISASASAYSSAVENDPLLTSDLNAVIIRDSKDPLKESEHYFRSTLASVSSLADLGVDSSLSFDKAEIDTTRATLYAARDTLRSSLSGYESTRSAISAEITLAGIQGESGSRGTRTAEIEQLAKNLAKKISSATEDILSAHRPEQLDVSSLLVM